MKQILAIDLNDAVSWACRARDGDIISATDGFNAKQIQSPGFQRLKFRNFLHDLCQEGKAELIAYRDSDSEAALFWLEAVQAHFRRSGAPLQAISAGAIKKHATGQGSAGRQAVLAAIRAKGHQAANEGEAMAVALLLFAESEPSLPMPMRSSRTEAVRLRRLEAEAELDSIRQADLEW